MACCVVKGNGINRQSRPQNGLTYLITQLNATVGNQAVFFRMSLSGSGCFTCLFVRVNLCFILKSRGFLFPMSGQVFSLRCVWPLPLSCVSPVSNRLPFLCVFKNPVFLSSWARLSFLTASRPALTSSEFLAFWSSFVPQILSAPVPLNCTFAI